MFRMPGACCRCGVHSWGERRIPDCTELRRAWLLRPPSTLVRLSELKPDLSSVDCWAEGCELYRPLPLPPKDCELPTLPPEVRNGVMADVLPPPPLLISPLTTSLTAVRTTVLASVPKYHYLLVSHYIVAEVKTICLKSAQNYQTANLLTYVTYFFKKTVAKYCLL